MHHWNHIVLYHQESRIFLAAQKSGKGNQGYKDEKGGGGGVNSDF